MNSLVPRRDFLARSLTTGAMGAVAAAALPRTAEAAPEAGAQRQLYELSIYQMGSVDRLHKADDYFEHALLPALKRAGAGPVGVFVESSKPEAPVVFVLITHNSPQSIGAVHLALHTDAEYQKAGAAFIAATKKDLAYENHEVRLMLAAHFMPALAVPEKKETRQFELRRYRNPSEAAFIKKLEMFGPAGELTIFRRVGLNPVFFGEMMFGPDMFNITYMLTYPDADARKKAWGGFGQDADWKKLRSTAGFTDAEIISDIKSLTLLPTAYSEI